MNNDEFIQEVLKQGWKKDEASIVEINDINLPEELFDLCSRFSFLSNLQENSWIYSVDYYKSKIDAAFEWDFFQKSSLECAMSSKQTEEINLFWQNQIPFVASVKSGYSYISCSKVNGSIWTGIEPEYEDSAEEICASLEGFKVVIIEHLNGVKINSFLEDFF